VRCARVKDGSSNASPRRGVAIRALTRALNRALTRTLTRTLTRALGGVDASIVGVGRGSIAARRDFRCTPSDGAPTAVSVTTALAARCPPRGHAGARRLVGRLPPEISWGSPRQRASNWPRRRARPARRRAAESSRSSPICSPVRGGGRKSCAPIDGPARVRSGPWLDDLPPRLTLAAASSPGWSRPR
jgi:hypothetical protein